MTVRHSSGLVGKRLSRREFQCAWLYASGLRRQQVADRLGITCDTVQSYLKWACWKLDVSGQQGLIRHFEADGAL